MVVPLAGRLLGHRKQRYRRRVQLLGAELAPQQHQPGNSEYRPRHLDFERELLQERGYPENEPVKSSAEPMVCGLSTGGRWIRTRMGLFLSSRCFWFVVGSL